jgi:ABC-2 type transport system permease protein
MSRFIWLIRREIWEHKAIWIAPAIVIACLLVLVVTGNVHLGPIGTMDDSTVFGDLSRDVQVKLLVIVYAGLALVVDMVMGIVAFFYALDSLYADRRDRSVLFWKSLPLSDAETVLSKFAVAAVVIPLVTLAAAVVAQLLVATGGSALAMEGMSAGVMWQPEAIMGGFAIALMWCVTAVLWYAPVISYLMLASAWAPKAPFLWAVLPPVAIWVLERVVLI